MANNHRLVGIGLGRFGSSVAESLVADGGDVVAIDSVERRVQELILAVRKSVFRNHVEIHGE